MTAFNSLDGADTGLFWIDRPDGNIAPSSAVTASITEMVNGNPNEGVAVLTVHNVVPQNQRIAFHCSVRDTQGNPWPQPLGYRVYYVCS